MLKNANTANGTKPTSTPPENGKKVETSVSLVPVKKEEQIPTPSVPGKQLSDLPPVEDRVLKIQQLSDFVAKREKLQESLKKLKSIKASSENRGLKITIEDDNDEWETFNTDAIKTCIASMEVTIKAKLDEVEKQICF
jgi:galactose mutarotase-like enzyme